MSTEVEAGTEVGEAQWAGEPGGVTLFAEEREPGVPGPPPLDDRTEISWAQMEGRGVVVKAATGAAGDALLREAEVLRRLPEGVGVEVVEVVEGPDHTELVTARFGLLSLGDARLMGPAERGRALGSLCRAVQVLHDAGWAHGRIDASHMLVDTTGEVRLCGFAAASHDTADLADDRAAPAAVVLESLVEPLGFTSGAARRRWVRATRRTHRELAGRRALSTPAELEGVLSDSGVEGVSDPAGSAVETAGAGARRVRPPSRRALAAGLLTAAAATALVAAVVGELTADDSAPSRTVSALSCPTGDHLVDIDGDGCPDPVTVSGNEVVAGARHWQVGRSGDVVTLGDWDCDHEATPAVLRPSTGEVFVFDEWAGSGSPSNGRALSPVAGGVDLRAPSGPCGAPRVVRADGSIVNALPAAAAPPQVASPTTAAGARPAPAPRTKGNPRAH